MAFIRNDSDSPQNGPFHVIAPGDVVEVPDRWLSRRDDRIRRGQFTVVDGPEPKPEKAEEKPEVKPEKAKPKAKKAAAKK